MNSQSIETIAKKITPLNKIFKGVFSSNNIEKFSIFPYCFVANTDRMGTSGKHWTAFYIKDKQSAEYFDSYGESPNEDLTIFLQGYSNVKKSAVKLQSVFADTCGYYVLYFLLLRSAGVKFDQIIMLLKNRADRDNYVKQFVLGKI